METSQNNNNADNHVITSSPTTLFMKKTKQIGKLIKENQLTDTTTNLSVIADLALLLYEVDYPDKEIYDWLRKQWRFNKQLSS